MTLPNTFEIHAKYNPASRHVATLNDAGTKYRIEARDCLENAYNAPVELSVRFVQEALDEGSWIMTKSLTVPVVEEKTMKFPLYCMHSNPDLQTEDKPESAIKIEEGEIPGFVKVTWRDGSVQTDFWTTSACERLIKNGTWLVKHVGEKTEEIAGSGFWITPGSIKAGSFSYAPNSTHADKGDTETNVAAPDSNTTVKLSIECDTSGAVAAINRLTQAYEGLAVSMESVLALTKELEGQA